MKAVQLVAPQRLEFVEIEPPTLKPGEVIVRMEYLAVCGSDLKFYDRVLSEQDYPLGVGRPCHECVGIVEESLDPRFQPGQRVIALTTQGGLVECASVSADLLVPLPDTDLDPSLWVFCQPMGTVMYALQRIGSVLGKRVAVVGQGPIGLLFTDLLVRHGARQVIVTDVHDYRLDVAKQLGATHTINARRENVAERVAEITGGALVDVSIEACGLAETYHQVFDVLRKQGTATIFGVPHLDDIIPFDWGTVYTKLPTIVVTNSAQAGERVESVGLCVDLVAQGRLDLSYLLTHRFGWEEIPRAFDLYSARKEECLKSVITTRATA